jgi:hypothetical protein
MTNTLHRFGGPETQENDFIVFVMAAKGINETGAVPKFQEFLRLAQRHKPVNMAHSHKGGIYRASEGLSPLAHWVRGDERIDPERIIGEIDLCGTVAAVFDNWEAMEAFVKDLKQADLGLSVNISALTDAANACCAKAGITRHSIEYSLGFHGDLNRLPDRHTLELSTMCGHGMLSHNFAKKMIDMVRENRRTPEQAATYMAKFCSCGIFNVSRARRILEQARKGN